jgi:hypothetical protein
MLWIVQKTPSGTNIGEKTPQLTNTGKTLADQEHCMIKHDKDQCYVDLLISAGPPLDLLTPAVPLRTKILRLRFHMDCDCSLKRRCNWWLHGH